MMGQGWPELSVGALGGWEGEGGGGAKSATTPYNQLALPPAAPAPPAGGPRLCWTDDTVADAILRESRAAGGAPGGGFGADAPSFFSALLEAPQPQGRNDAPETLLGFDPAAAGGVAGGGGGGGSAAQGAQGGSPAEADDADADADAAEVEDDGDPRPWRCLDSSHEAGCRRCTPPPSGAGCVLRGGRPRAQSGEKQLRGALCRTPEWRCADTRAAAAAALDAAGAASAASAVRKRDCSALRKADMLQLCRLWRYASHVWQPSGWFAGPRAPRAPGEAPPRAKRPPRRVAARAPFAPQLQQQPQPGISHQVIMHAAGDFLQPMQMEPIAIFVASTLAPAVAQFLSRGATPSLFAAGAAEPHAPTLVHARGAGALAPALSRIAASIEADLQCVQAAAAAADAAEGWGGAAASGGWGVAAAAAAPPLAETALHVLQLLAHGRAAYLTDVTNPVSGVAARNRRGLSAPERGHVSDAAAADAALRRFLAAAAAMLARCREGDLRSYLAAAAEVLSLAAGAMRGAAASAARRAAWAHGRECSWPKPLLRYIAAASMPAAAAAAIADAQALEAAAAAAEAAAPRDGVA